jgi:glycosyltransferase involved in cell wall biosynthesis
MKVLHIITGLDVGGAEQQLRLLLRHCDVRSAVVTLTEPGPLAEAIRADGVPVTALRMSGNRDIGALPRLTALIRAGEYDVVHTHLYRACVYGRIAARLAGVRTIVATEHSLGASSIEGRPLSLGTRALYRATERLGHGTFAVSATVARRLAEWGVPARRIHLAPNGIEPGRFRFDAGARARTRDRLGIPQDAYVVGGVGRQVPGKRFDAVVRAVADNPGTHLLLAGDGIERVPLLRLVHSLGLQNRALVVDPTVHGVPDLLSAMDLFVTASEDEAFGLAALEALAAGLPVRYVTCPAVEDLPPEAAPGARQVAPDQLAAAVREEHLAGPRRLPPPQAVEHYHIARTAELVTARYLEAHYRGGLFRRRRTPVPAAVPRPAGPAAPAAQEAATAPPAAAPQAPAPAAEDTPATPAQK